MTRQISRWLAAIAVMIGTGGLSASAQAPAPGMGEGPPPPPMMAPPAPRPAVGPPGVAAVVNGQKITKAQVQTLAMQAFGAQVLDRLVTFALIDQEAKKQRITVTPAEVNARVGEVRQEVAKSPGRTLEGMLEQSNQTLAQFKDGLRVQLEAEKLLSKSMQSPNVIHARHLLIYTDNPRQDPAVKPHTEVEAKRLISQAQAELKAGKSFEEVARKYSEDQYSRTNGGDLGLVGTSTPFDQAFLQAALTLKPGQVTPEAVKSIYGYHLIKADSTLASHPTSENKVYDDFIHNSQRQQLSQAIQPYIQNLRSKAKVTTYRLP